MGCDIHVHIEVKIEDTWHHYNHPSVNRWYQMFYKMAGVRGPREGITPINYHKGLPLDASPTIKFDYEYEGDDAHTPGWLDHKQILELSQWLKISQAEIDFLNRKDFTDRFGYLFGNDFDYLIPGVQDVRLIFWFDN